MKEYSKPIRSAENNLNRILNNLNTNGYTVENLIFDINLVEKQLDDIIDSITDDLPDTHAGSSDNVRGRAYVRRERYRNIRRKARILRNTTGESSVKHIGMLSKGKVHCSCRLCRAKSSDYPHISRLREDERTKAMLNEYENEDSDNVHVS